jgi:hypothetical protein
LNLATCLFYFLSSRRTLVYGSPYLPLPPATCRINSLVIVEAVLHRFTCFSRNSAAIRSRHRIFTA